MLRTLAIRCSTMRGLHTTLVKRINPQNVEEIKIPVPWGHIAGKWWGRREDPLILAVHGWQDNAGSWDLLVEKLPSNYSVLAVDMPGNGQSSHMPPFMSYTVLETPSILKRVTNYLNQGKVHLLGHSGGSAVCFLYSSVFPEDVCSYFGVDYLAYCYKNEQGRLTALAKTIDKHLTLALRDPRRAKHYSWDEVKERWIAATKGSLTAISAEILMKRGVNKLPDSKVVLSRDNRVKNADMNLLHVNQLESMIKEFKTPTCLVRAKNSIYFYDRGVKNFPEILDKLKNTCSLFEYHEIDGNHHVHMDKPDEVSEIYLSFLSNVDASEASKKDCGSGQGRMN